MQRRPAGSRVSELEKLVHGLHGNIGIGHTRWATLGVPSERNAHRRVSGGVSVVHNGIIENHEEMRPRLKGLGYQFFSDTDSEVIAHLVPLQLLAYHAALMLGNDVDKPRNVAKSVTVE